jgi:hypothetical protein
MSLTMERFLLLIREDVKLQSAVSDSFFNAHIHEMTRWVAELVAFGNYLAGEPLRPCGSYVSKDCILSKGPFIEDREVVSGYILIQAENLAQAGSIVQTCPVVLEGRIVIEVRPIVEGGL